MTELHGNSPSASLNNLWNLYTKHKATMLKGTTIQGRYKTIANHIASLETDELGRYQKIVNAIAEEHSSSVARWLITYISACCDWAVSQGHISYNPFHSLAKKVKHYEAESKELGSVDEVYDPSQLPVIYWTGYDNGSLYEAFDKRMLEGQGLIITKMHYTESDPSGKPVRVLYDNAYVRAWLLEQFKPVEDEHLGALIEYAGAFFERLNKTQAKEPRGLFSGDRTPVAFRGGRENQWKKLNQRNRKAR